MRFISLFFKKNNRNMVARLINGRDDFSLFQGAALAPPLVFAKPPTQISM
jgi:hypothetical protein